MRFSIFGIVENGVCEADIFISEGDAGEQVSRDGLRTKLMYLAKNGFQGVPDKWSHEVNKKHQIYELIHGKLRLFYFKGVNGHLAICTGGVRKKGQKVDLQKVAKAIRMKNDYFVATSEGTLETEK